MNHQGPAAATEWTMNKVLPMFAMPQRWKILLFLAENGPQTASALPGGQSRKGHNVILKQLAAMRRAGFIVKTENERDGRKSLYSISPTLPVRKTNDGIELDFDFVLFRLRGKNLEMTSRAAAPHAEPQVVARPAQPPAVFNPLEQRIAELERRLAQITEQK